MTGEIQVEGASLEEALQKAAKELGVERRAVAFKYDREHLASGASTVKIYASRMSDEEVAKRAAEESARPPAPRSEARDRGPPRDRGDRGDRGPRDRDRAGRGGDRGGPRGRDDRRGPPRDRGERRDFGDRDRRPYQKPEKDPERDERLRERARELGRKALAGDGPQFIEDLNSYERHLVHTAIAEMGGLETKSEGEQLRKKVHISKKEA